MNNSTIGKIIDYDYVFDEHLMDIPKEVKKAIKEGWQPFGTPFEDGNRYVQFIVKYEEGNKRL